MLDILKVCVQKGASDVHIVASGPPILRVRGDIKKVKGKDLTGEEAKNLVYSVMNDKQRSDFEEKKTLDFSFGIRGIGRFRANVFYQKGLVSGVFRRLESRIPELKELGISVLQEITDYSDGLVLFTGATGSGKTTSITALLNHINTNHPVHIVTLEDPIEYIHDHKKGVVNQREIGKDVPGFEEGLVGLLRQDPDVCLIGELRDKETITTSLKLAETGHLVFGTVHSYSAVQCVSRIVGAFPPEHQSTVLNQLSFSLRVVVYQNILTTIDNSRIVALEILKINTGISNLLREGKIHQIYGLMQSGQGASGMITMNQCLANYVKNNIIDTDTAYEASHDVKELSRLLGK